MLMDHNPSITPYEYLFWQGTFMMLINYLYVSSFDRSIYDIGKQYRNVIVARCILGFNGIQGKLASVKYMPVSTSSCIFFTMPIFSTLFASLILKESFTKMDAFQLAVAFCGVLVINNPFSAEKSSSDFSK